MSLTNEGIPMTMPVQPAGTSNGGGFGGFGGDGAWWIIILFLFVFCGWGNGGWGGNGGGSGVQGALTRGDLCQDMNFNDLQNGVRNVNDAVNLGFANLNSTICHQQYDTAMLVNGVQGAVTGGFAALNSTICQQQYETAGQLNGINTTIMQGNNALQAQLAQCCCDQRAATADLKYTIANEDCQTRNLIQSTTRDMIDNNNANTRAILDKLTAQEIAAKDAQIAAQNQQIFALQLGKSQATQTAELNAQADARMTQMMNVLNPRPVPAYPAASPCGLGNWSPAVLANYGYAYNNGCGCGCGCNG